MRPNTSAAGRTAISAVQCDHARASPGRRANRRLLSTSVGRTSSGLSIFDRQR